MALENLIISHQKISKELLEGVLKGRVELIQEGRKVVLTKGVHGLPNKVRILLFLGGGKAWELLDQETWAVSPEEMTNFLAITGNTLRPILKEFRDNFLVQSEKGKYQILPKGIFELETTLYQGEKQSKLESSSEYRHRSRKSTKRGSRLKKSDIFNDLIKEGFFKTQRSIGEVYEELARRGVNIKYTSIPSYLLPLLRKKILSRDRETKGKRKIWVYKSS